MCGNWRNWAKKKSKKPKTIGWKKAAVKAKEMRERKSDCQEVKKPTESDHDEGMDGRGLGMACEKSMEGGGVFVLFTYWDPGCMITTLLQSHRPPTAHPPPFLSSSPLCVSLISVSVFPSTASLLPSPPLILSGTTTLPCAQNLQGLAQVAFACYTLRQHVLFSRGGRGGALCSALDDVLP